MEPEVAPDVWLWQLKLFLRRLSRQSSSLKSRKTECSTILASMKHQRTNHRYNAPTRHIRCLYQLVQDIGFLLDLTDDIYRIEGTSRSDNAGLLGHVLDCLGQKLKQRNSSTFIFELQKACLDLDKWHDRIEYDASTYNKAQLMLLLLQPIGWAIHQGIQSAKSILLKAELADPKDFET